MSTPWNHGVTQKWTRVDYSDKATMPHHNQRVIAVDCLGNQAVCVFDGMSYDFLLELSGIDSKGLLQTFLGAMLIATEKRFPGFSDLKALDDEGFLDDISESFINEANEPVYFTNVEYWMLAPPPPSAIFSIHTEDSAEEVTFMTYDLMNAIEPSIRAAISAVVGRERKGGQP